MPARFENTNSVKQGSPIENGISYGTDDDIVITGISGRFPESSNVEEFKENLMNEIDMITDDEVRWTAGIYGLPLRHGKIKDIVSFDASFFGVPPKQADMMDPALRMMLEATFEAIVDAGINPSTIRGSRTGVFIGASNSESEEFWMRNPDVANGYGLIGCSRAMFANRISYTFDFHGPSYAVDTACSSSLYALHHAITAIRSGECDGAIVGGVNLLLKPLATLQFHRLNMLSQDGKCKSFDASGNGYVRAEAASVIYLQKAKNARRVYATAIISKTNTDGSKPEGITYPNGDMQNQLMHEVYSECGINPADIIYLEAHGTGTKVGDPEEVNSVDKLFCNNRRTPLLMGSVKSNMGHSEPASGLCSIAKVLIAMETGVIPANLHYKSPNPDIPALCEGRIKVVDKATPWNGGLVAINSFGFGGANAHIVLRSNPKSKLPPIQDTTLPRLVTVSGRTEEAVHELLNKAKQHQTDAEFLYLLHSVHKNAIQGHKFCGYEILSSDHTREVDKTVNYDEKRPIWFIFSGMGTQWPGMARDLLGIEIFRHSIQRCANALKTLGLDLMDMIMNATNETYHTNVINSFVSIATMQIAFVDLLASIGIHPDGIVGHSVGELGCAYADGTFSLEQTILAAYWRGKALMDSNLKPGAMAAVGLSWEDTKNICPPDIIPACHNSKDSVTVSGPVKSVFAFVEQLKGKNIFAKVVHSSGVAFHSKYIATAASILRKSLDDIIPNPKPRSTKWLSTSIPEAEWNSPLAQFSSAAYHVNNLISPVHFYEALTHIPSNAITIEIAPHCLLQAILRRSLSPMVTNIALHKLGHSNNLSFLLSNLGKLYIAGAKPDISKLYPSINFPVGRGTPMIGPLVKWDHSVTWEICNFKNQSDELRENIVEINLSKEEDSYIADHKIDGRILFPGTGYIVLVWKIFAKLHNVDYEQLPVILKNVRIERATIMPKKDTVKFSINIFRESGNFEISESSAVVVSGNIAVLHDTEKNVLQLPILPAEKEMLLLKDIYKDLRLRGYEYSGIFQGIKSSDSNAKAGELLWNDNWIAYIDSMLQFQIIPKKRLLYVPSRIQSVIINPVAHKKLVAKLSKDNGLIINHYKNINITKSGGVEIRGLKASLAPRRQQTQTNTKYERYTFVPYENSYSLDKDALKGKSHAVTVLMQTLCENVSAIKIKVIEVTGERTAETLLAPLVHDILCGELTISVELQIVTTSPDNYISNLNEMNVNAEMITRDVNNVAPGQNVHLVIAANVLSNQSYTILKNLEAALKPGGFILLEEIASHFDFKIALDKTSLVLAAKQIDSTGKNYILLKKRENTEKPIVIQITDKNISWLENLKVALRKSESENQNMLVVCQGEQLTGIVGFMNCLRRESSGSNVRYVFIQDTNAPAFSLSTQFYSNQLDKGLMANILKENQWGTYRHLKLYESNESSVQVEHAYVNTLARGDLHSLSWIQSPLSSYQSNKLLNTTLCTVYYAPLNFRDIMLATGKLPPDALPGKMATEECILGLEFSGRDVSGRRVMGVVEAKGLATTLLADSDFLWEIPDAWSMEEAATIPVAYSTSYYALCIRGRLKKGETVLIHAGTGGVGQAAIAIALHAGCIVFTTVGTPEKRAYLKNTFPQLTDRYIGNSRDTSFEQLILSETEGRGVDLVLNSLAEEKLQASIRCLAINGRFLEIGKYDLSNDNCIGMSMFLKNTAFHGILLDSLFEYSAEKTEVVKMVSEGIKNGAVRPLPSIVFSEQQLQQGFRYMAAGKHIGKVLVKIRDEESRKQIQPVPKTIPAIPRTYMNPDKSYVLVGGLGGFGLELADWLITRGAKFLVLVSRSGIRTGYQALCIQRWLENGIKIVISTAQATTLSGAERLIEESNSLAPVGGIFNLAAVLRDDLIEVLEESDFKKVMLPKIDVTKNLDIISRKSCQLLNYFVVFSSVSCGRGNIGQTNYGLANSAMERMMEKRQTDGFPGLAIQWGAIGDVGLVIETMGDNTTVVGGTVPQTIANCLATLDIFLQQPHPILSSIVLPEQQHFSDSNEGIGLLEVVVNILGIKDVNLMNPNDSLSDVGMDSLMGAEIKQTLERNYDIILSPLEIRALTIAQLQDLSCNNSNTTKKKDSIVSKPAMNSSTTDSINGLLSPQWPSTELLPKEVIVRLKTMSTEGPPLFIVHAIEGVINVFETLASELKRPLWGLQSVENAPHDTISDLAEFYMNAIKKIQKKSPYHIAGYSFGACVALEMAMLLESAGEQVFLTLIDGSPEYIKQQCEVIGKIDLGKDLTSDSCTKSLAFFSIQFNPTITYFQAYKALKNTSSEIEMFDKMLGLIDDTSYSRNDLKIAGYLLFKKLAAAVVYNPDKKFNGPTTLIKATDNYVYLEKDYGLSKICKQPLKIREVPGNHRTMLEESAKKIAKILQI